MGARIVELNTDVNKQKLLQILIFPLAILPGFVASLYDLDSFMFSLSKLQQTLDPDIFIFISNLNCTFTILAYHLLSPALFLLLSFFLSANLHLQLDSAFIC